jgi:coenzyme F420 hydrogenase subunit beta
MTKLCTISDVVDWRLCLGCGACAYICPDRRISLANIPAEGIRPQVAAGDCAGCSDCMDVCPVNALDFAAAGPAPDLADQTYIEWGRVLEVWEGHSSDPETRRAGASGGVMTALSRYCLEAGGMHGVLHIGQSPADPLANSTRLSRTPAELLAAAGSRYAPASVCDRLDLVESAPAPCAVVGRPVEIAAVRKAARLRPALRAKLGVTVSFFCAEAPSQQGTIALIRKLGLAPESIRRLRYRGQGWPGHFEAVSEGQSAGPKLTYDKSWGFLQAFRPWAAHVWPDGSGELADISCGDPWYVRPDGVNPGSSLIVVRTEAGRRIVAGAIAAGYVSLAPAETWKITASQRGLLHKKGAIWGRRLVLTLFGAPTTHFAGLNLWACWRGIPLTEKISSLFGTFRRVWSRRLFRRRQPLPC